MSANTITNPETAKAVLTTAKENSVWEAAIATDEDKLLKDATFVYDQATTAWNNGMRGKAVTSVMAAAEVLGASEGEDFKTPDIKEDHYDPTGHKVTQVVEHISSLEQNEDLEQIESIQRVDDRKGVQRACDAAVARLEKIRKHEAEVEPSLQHNLVKDDEEPRHPLWVPKEENKSKFDETFEAEQFARAQAAKMNLPIPERVDDIPNATLSRNVATLTIQELAEKLTDASLCLAAATWQTAIAEIDEEHSKRVGEHYFNKEYSKVAKDAKNQAEATAQAEAVEEVKRWRDAEAKAEARYIAFRALKEIYQGTHNTISRIFAMKQEERERRL